MNKKLLWVAMFAAAGLAGCNDGKDGPQGPQGPQGPTGPVGPGVTPPVAEIINDTNVNIIGYELGDNVISFEFQVTNEEGLAVDKLNRAYAKVASVQDGGLGTPRDGGTGYYSHKEGRYGPEMTEGATLEQTETGIYKFTTPISVTPDMDAHISLRVGGDVIPSTPYLIVRTSEAFAKTTTDSGCFTCHESFNENNPDWYYGAHANDYMGEYSNLFDDKEGQVAFVDSCMNCHNQITKSPKDDNGDYVPGVGGYATNTMQKIGHVNHKEFVAGFDGLNCTSCHVDQAITMPEGGRGCSDCHSSMGSSSFAADADYRAIHEAKHIDKRKQLLQDNAFSVEVIQNRKGEWCNYVTAKPGVDLQTMYENNEFYLSTYLHSYDADNKLFVNRALHNRTAPKTVEFEPSRNVMAICWIAEEYFNDDRELQPAEPGAWLPGYDLAGSVRLTWTDVTGDGKNVMVHANSHEIRNVMSDESCTGCHNAAHTLEDIFMYDKGDGTAKTKPHATYGGLSEGGLGCIACHNSGMTRGESAGWGPMIHDFHFGAKAKERGAFDSTKASADKLDGANCKACHSDGVDLNDVPAFYMLVKNSGSKAPISANCTSCHTSDSAKAHVELNGGDLNSSSDNTVEAQESCAVCHAEGKSFGIDKFHNVN
ncbi:multiheme c-type cytochrome [Paraferrimonas sedimenticola]|uniref:Outer membrane cytochrome MtrC/MtrF-like domain-containing protein n=1 Tax=Paraferrimonas sedimenticola TaxID=375674 RepID=A0AA37RV22_9GAMM|nr:hypothetical protein [Paraferrimonas sedimenticola]GLP95414.1 hypothetical protein GCM10007895_07200 [Paraferrimonas sedimenticola]